MERNPTVDPMGFLSKINPYWLLGTGIFTLALSHMIFSVDLLAWVSSVPFLIFLRVSSGKKSVWWFFLALFTALSVVVTKIITPPIPFAFVFLYSLPFTLIQIPGYLLWRRTGGYRWATLVFPAVMTLVEWLQYTFTPFASWCVAAYTQSHNPTLMQSLSLFGMPGLSFLVYWANAAIADFLLQKQPDLKVFKLPGAVLLALCLFGSLRMDFQKSTGRDTVLAAAIGTDSKFSGLPLPTPGQNAPIKSALLDRTRAAAKSGAEMVVWNEAAVIILPEEEAAWKDTLVALAKETAVSLVAAFVVPVSVSPLKYENKYLLIAPDGRVLVTYHKHQPVPGEPAVKGKEPLQVSELGGIRLGGAICYDYDFPYLAKGFGDLGADLVAVPSSDWRGIDPLHTRMAAFRAVEQGHSILRSTRFGLSAGINPLGEMVAQMSSFDKNNKIMLAHLPRKGTGTLYSILGDWVILLCAGLLLAGFRHLFKARETAGAA